MSRTRRRLGIFGGTFDPPHLGHLILAAEALDQLQLDKVLWVVTPQPPHKLGEPHTPLPLRAALVYAAIGDNPAFELSTVEMERPGPHYTVDTLRILRGLYPDDALVFLVGADSLVGLPTWRQPEEILRLVDEIGVMRRPGEEVHLEALEARLPGLRARVREMRAPLLEIASREIRRRVAEGRPYAYYLPPAVALLIDRWGLYREVVASTRDVAAQEPLGGVG